MFTNYRITSRIRFTIFLVMLFLIASMGLSLLLGLNQASASAETETITITVHTGDTLWDLADRYTGDSVDIRQVVYEIKELNQLDSNVLEIGTSLIIPIYS